MATTGITPDYWIVYKPEVLCSVVALKTQIETRRRRLS